MGQRCDQGHEPHPIHSITHIYLYIYFLTLIVYKKGKEIFFYSTSNILAFLLFPCLDKISLNPSLTLIADLRRLSSTTRLSSPETPGVDESCLYMIISMRE